MDFHLLKIINFTDIHQHENYYLNEYDTCRKPNKKMHKRSFFFFFSFIYKES